MRRHGLYILYPLPHSKPGRVAVLSSNRLGIPLNKLLKKTPLPIVQFACVDILRSQQQSFLSTISLRQGYARA